jgi:hypothetical protein
MELPNTIEELLKLEAELVAAFKLNVNQNAGTPQMQENEEAILDELNTVRDKLDALGYVKPPRPEATPELITQEAPVSEEKKKRKRRKKKSHSRASRAADAAGALTMLGEELDGAVSTLRELAKQLEDEETEEEPEPEVKPETVPATEPEADSQDEEDGADFEQLAEDIDEEISRISTLFDEAFSTSEVQDLADEMRSWSDNVQGTNLENTDKMQTVSETADTLENAVSTLDNLSFPEYDGKDLNSFADELEQLAQDLSDAASEIENCEFPGMGRIMVNISASNRSYLAMVIIAALLLVIGMSFIYTYDTIYAKDAEVLKVASQLAQDPENPYIRAEYNLAVREYMGATAYFPGTLIASTLGYKTDKWKLLLDPYPTIQTGGFLIPSGEINGSGGS